MCSQSDIHANDAGYAAMAEAVLAARVVPPPLGWDVRVARYTTGEDPAYGIVEGPPGSEVVLALQGDPLYIGLVPGEGEIPLEEVRLLAPVIPRSKVIGIGRNYADHAREMGNEVPAEPLMFLSPNTAVVGPGDPVVLPRQSDEVHYEGELALVIGKIAKDVRVEDALDCIWGYTVANDVTARDLQKTDGQWARAKGFDTFCPLGPWVETDLDVSDLRLVTRLDGEVVQDGTTARHGPPGRLPHRARVGRVHAAAGRRDPHRDAERRRTGSGRPAGQRGDRGDRHARQPVRAPLTPGVRTRARARAARMRRVRSAGRPGWR